jgi:hypothetical protein
VEWHLPPEYILDNWTDEELEIMVEKLVERKDRELRALGKKTPKTVPEPQFFAQAGIKYKKVHSGNKRG